MYLTPKELSERWRGLVTVKTMANWRAQNPVSYGPTFTKFGGKVLYPLAGVVEFEEAQQFASTREYKERRRAEVVGRPSSSSRVAQVKELAEARQRRLDDIAEARQRLDDQEADAHREFEEAMVSVRPKEERSGRAVARTRAAAR